MASSAPEHEADAPDLAAPARSGRPASTSHRRLGHQQGALSLEAVLVLPLLALLMVGLLGAVGVLRDVLLLHEAARAGARAAATTTGSAPVHRAAREAAPEVTDLRVRVSPTVRRDGDLARVEVTVTRRLGPVAHRLRAEAVSRVEPAAGLPGSSRHAGGDRGPGSPGSPGSPGAIDGRGVLGNGGSREGSR